jgi:hypothetical protein
LFRAKPDSMSLTMALVEAYASGDQAMIDQARQHLTPVSTKDVIWSLYRFGQILSRAALRPEQTEAIEEELQVTAESPEMTAAIQNIGKAILIDRNEPALVEAVNTYGPPLLNSASDQLRKAAFAVAAVVGTSCRRLEVRFNWK